MPTCLGQRGRLVWGRRTCKADPSGKRTCLGEVDLSGMPTCLGEVDLSGRPTCLFQLSVPPSGFPAVCSAPWFDLSGKRTCLGEVDLSGKPTCLGEADLPGKPTCLGERSVFKSISCLISSRSVVPRSLGLAGDPVLVARRFGACR